MNGSAEYLVEILKKADKLIIPVYQRNYDWKEEHCITLYNDLVKTIRDNRKTHFFGGIVSVNDPDGGRGDWLIIDGQQRITSVSLLLLALANLIKEGKIETNDERLVDTIIKRFLADEINPNDRKIKLKPIKGDSEAFENLWGDPKDYKHASNVTLNYNYFYNRILKGELTASQLFEAVQRLQVVDITLTLHIDNPQLVFESLNSTGLDLTEGDKIRNYILMGLEVNTQEQYYNNYWNPIEKKAGYDKNSNSYNVSWFIRDYLTIRQRKIPNINSVYASFKEYAEPSHDTCLEQLLKDMLDYARRYEKLNLGSPDFPDMLNASINRLNRFESSVTRPFLLEVLRLNEESIISADDTTKVFRIVESYLLRRQICDLPSNALNKVFMSLATDIKRLDGTWDNFLDKMKYSLSSRKEKARFPDDVEFEEGLLHKNIYKMPARYKAYILERFENGDSQEYKSIYEKIDKGDYTIEHIMPQELDADWQEDLGSEYESIHETWLHRLANLTLSAYNSNYQNYSFNTKRTMKDGYLDSGLKMNQLIAQNTKWGITELEARARQMTKQAFKLWENAKTEYTPPEKQYDEYSLEDDVVFTNKWIMKYRLNGVEQEVQSWTDMYVSVLKILHEKNKSVLNYLADADDSVDLSIHISRTEDTFSKSGKIDEGIYVWINTSTQYKVNLLLKFFELFGEDPANLIFVMKENQPVVEDSNPRYALRQAFWTQALPAIREASGVFRYVNPSTSNTISGATSCAGMYYNCVANYENARIELYFSSSDKEINKAVFDALLMHKAEIEKDYGASLRWERMDELKSSKISDQLDGVSITNEGDWSQMTEFLSKGIGMLKKACQNRLEVAYAEVVGQENLFNSQE